MALSLRRNQCVHGVTLDCHHGGVAASKNIRTSASVACPDRSAAPSTPRNTRGEPKGEGFGPEAAPSWSHAKNIGETGLLFHRRTRATVPVGARAPSCSNPRVEIAYLFLGLVTGDAVAFLQLARQVFRTSGCGLEIVVRELAPAGLQRAAELLPLALDRVLVHPVLLWRLDPGYPQALQLAFELVYL